MTAGAFVVIADLNEEAGTKLHHEFPKATAFVRCDVTSWESQLSAFKKTKNISPGNRIDIVVANAGISNNDQILPDDIDTEEPTEPNLQITNVNVVGVLLTSKLALWYFCKQNIIQPNRDQCLVLQGSVTGYVDIYGAPQYTLSKFAMRGLMRSLRQSERAHGFRVNLIAPWFVLRNIPSLCLTSKQVCQNHNHHRLTRRSGRVVRCRLRNLGGCWSVPVTDRE